MTRAPGTLRWLAIATVAVTYCLVVLGDTVRVTHSGMGCRSWPLCNGNLGLAGNYHAMLEQSHRYLAAIVTVLVVTTFIVAWRQTSRNRTVRRAALAALVMIAIQVPLGAITVFAHNAGWTVAMHLAGAWLLVAAVTTTMVVTLKSTTPGLPPVDKGVVRALSAPLYTALAALFLLAVAGMLVLHLHATLSCPSWPLCPSSAQAPGVLLQYLHRTMALVATIALVWLALRAWRTKHTPALVRRLSALVIGLLLLTAAFGAVVAVTGAPEYAQDLHLALASLLWLCLVTLASYTLLQVGETAVEPQQRELAASVNLAHLA